MADEPFIGRDKELTQLQDLLKKKTASLVVIKGRRRVGKTRLIEEFSRGHTFYSFAGLAPEEGITPQHQRDHFATVLKQQTGYPALETKDWSELFFVLQEKTKTGRVIILLDEITWMAQGDPTFLPKLKDAWDRHFKKNPKLILVLCGSVSAWIEKNIMSSTGYFGRISEKITLKPLSLPYSNQLLEAIGFKRSNYEKLLMLGLTGGIPWYIEQVRSNYSAADNIKRLCFDPDGLLYKEHDYIFHDLFGRKSDVYSKIAGFLAKGAAEYDAIAQGINYSSSGVFSEYLEELIESGYISRDYSWSIKTGATSKISTYRLSDNYLRFYYKYIANKEKQIVAGQFDHINLAALPEWETVMGLQFENLVLFNRKLIQEKLHIRPEDIVSDNPYFQRQTKRHRGCQVDYLIQVRTRTLFIFEIKFSKKEIKSKVIEEVKEKIKRLAVPPGFACVPVLIHINGVTDAVIDSDYFLEIIDFSECL